MFDMHLVSDKKPLSLLLCHVYQVVLYWSFITSTAEAAHFYSRQLNNTGRLKIILSTVRIHDCSGMKLDLYASAFAKKERKQR